MKTLREVNEEARKKREATERAVRPLRIEPSKAPIMKVGIQCDKCYAEMEADSYGFAVSLNKKVRCPNCGYTGTIESSEPRPIVRM